MMQRAPVMPVPCFTDPAPTASRPDFQQLKAAAARAAAQAAHGVRTQFFDHAADVGPFDPLALVLSYGEEEEEDEEQDGERGHARAGASSERNLLTAISGHEHGSPDPLAGFLSELQSEGLLDAEDEAAAAALVAPDPQPELLVGPGSGAGATDREVAHALRGSAAATAQQREELSGTSGSAAQPQVLRWVAGGPWARVRDAASGHEFFWQSDTKESAWTLPKGVVDTEPGAGAQLPDVQQERAAAGGASLSSPLTQPVLQALSDGDLPRANGADQTAATTPPDGWLEARDEASGDVYYWHTASGAVQWERPAGAVASGVRPADAGAQMAAPSALGTSAALDSASEQLAALVDDDPAVDDSGPEAASTGAETPAGALRAAEHTTGRAEAEEAEAQHARASTALEAALSEASQGGTLAALFATAPRLLLLHARLQTRQQDLAALRSSLQGAGASAGARAAAAAACRYLEEDVAAAAAELPAARTAAEALLLELPDPTAPRSADAVNGEAVRDAIADPATSVEPLQAYFPTPSGSAHDAEATAEPAPPLPESDPASPLATERVALPSNNGQSPPPLPSDDAAPSQDAFANHSKPAAVQPVASLSAAVAGIAPARASARPDAAVAAEQGTGAKRRAQPSAVGGTPKRAKRSVVGRSGALVSKWQSVAKDMEVEEAARQQPGSLMARELVKSADIEEWIAQQHRTGEARANPNFIPLSSDWRARIAARADAAREAAEARQADDAAPEADEAVLRFDSAPDLELLSAGLQDGWQAMWDSSSGVVYYGNVAEKVRAEA